MAPLWRAAAWCLSKEGNFQSFTCALKWLRPCAESTSQSQCVLDIFKLSARAQRRCPLSANHCQVYGSPFRANFIDTWLLMQSQKQTHKTHGLTLVRVIIVGGIWHQASRDFERLTLDLYFSKMPQKMVMCYRNINIFCLQIAKITWQQIKCRKNIKKNISFICYKTISKHCLTHRTKVDRIESWTVIVKISFVTMSPDYFRKYMPVWPNIFPTVRKIIIIVLACSLLSGERKAVKGDAVSMTLPGLLLELRTRNGDLVMKLCLHKHMLKHETFF